MPLTSFYSALTGLNNNSITINVIGSNLANINSTAYKASRTSFAELVGGSTETGANRNPIQFGLGSSVAGVSPIFSQGAIQLTGRTSDVAISGNGFFVVQTGNGVGYTRNGTFSFANDGSLINVEGYKVLGYPAINGVVNSNTTVSPIVIAKGSSQPPSATTSLSLAANLDSRAGVADTFTSAVQVYDSLGDSHTVTFTFTKTGVGAWNWAATVPAVEAGGAATDAPEVLGSGALTFDDTGVLTAPTTNPALTLSGLSNGAADLDIDFQLYDNNNQPRLTGFGATSAVSTSIQNGYPASLLRELTFNSDGTISGVYESGQVRPLAQLALASFPNSEGMVKFKGSTYAQGGASGEPSIGTPNTGGRGTLTGSALELSNVDIATEFTTLITAQRGYQANSRVITVTDELYQDAINLKR
jgi:flagellar hook protein FlgE